MRRNVRFHMQFHLEIRCIGGDCREEDIKFWALGC